MARIRIGKGTEGGGSPQGSEVMGGGGQGGSVDTGHGLVQLLNRQGHYQ